MLSETLSETLTVVLAGGVGSRLQPLTDQRAKPAVPFGGKYRIIDFTLTNCLHSGLRRVLVLTQYKSHSLQKHLRDGWSIFNPELGEYITPVPPQMRTGENWYSGTADAIYQNLYLLERSGAEWVVILSGDHIYRMDYAPMIEFHKQSGASATIACMEVDIKSANRFGIMALDSSGKIVNFWEKPDNPPALEDNPNLALASMGIYVFSTRDLIAAVTQDHNTESSGHDFGSNILPLMIDSQQVYGYRFGGDSGRVSPDRYWRDVGTIDAYYQSNMDLLEAVPPMNLYQPDWQIRTYSGQYPPARTAQGEYGSEGIFINSIVSSGSVISGGVVQESILFHNVRINNETAVERSILFDGVEVGNGVQLKNCIIDKYVKVPDGERIGYDLEKDRQRFTISPENIVVVPKGYVFN
ncbi:MAG: glucose-1-phosphate adenylyltransferase [Gammaproteobacteria bacterium]|jgi:glucose-1-phosphate adenylyltransferase